MNTEKNGYLLAAVAASLALGHVSDTNSNNEGFSPMASFLSAENCDYTVDSKIEMGLGEAGRKNGAGHG